MSFEVLFRNNPLVSIGMPVRNGGVLLREALASVVAQDYSNLEIIVSDNASTDETADIVKEFQANDTRIRYMRHERILPAFDNFCYVLAESRGDFFCWAAHDDTRSPNFVSMLLTAFSDPDVVLAFGTLSIKTSAEGVETIKPYDFDNADMSPLARMTKQGFQQCYQMYGLWRSSVLKRVHWAYTPWWPDLVLLVTVAAIGTFKFVPGANFVYFEILKTDEHRASYHDILQASPKVISVLRLLKAMFVTAFRSLPPHYATAAFLIVIVREARDFADWLTRRLLRLFSVRQARL